MSGGPCPPSSANSHGDRESFLTKDSYLHPVVDVTEDVGCIGVFHVYGSVYR